jgi:hypothetical protein
MPTSAQPNGSPSDRPDKSRLEREIEEILERSERENPLPPPTPIRPEVKRPMEEFTRNVEIPDVGASIRRWLESMGIFVAFMLAIVALMVSNISPFLAHIVAIGAVVALFWPVVTANRGPKSMPKSWRGTTYTGRQDPPETVTRFQDWLRKKGILK